MRYNTKLIFSIVTNIVGYSFSIYVINPLMFIVAYRHGSLNGRMINIKYIFLNKVVVLRRRAILVPSTDRAGVHRKPSQMTIH